VFQGNKFCATKQVFIEYFILIQCS